MDRSSRTRDIHRSSSEQQSGARAQPADSGDDTGQVTQSREASSRKRQNSDAPSVGAKSGESRNKEAKIHDIEDSHPQSPTTPKHIQGDATNESQFNESSSSAQLVEGPSSIPDMESHPRKKIKRIPAEVETKIGLTITDHIENLTSKYIGGYFDWSKTSNDVSEFDRNAVGEDMEYNEYAKIWRGGIYCGEYEANNPPTTPIEISKKIRIYKDVTVEAFALEEDKKVDLWKIDEILLEGGQRAELGKLFEHMSFGHVCMGVPIKQSKACKGQHFDYAAEGWFAKDETRKTKMQYNTDFKISTKPCEAQRANDCWIVYWKRQVSASSVCEHCRKTASIDKIQFPRRHPSIRTSVESSQSTSKHGKRE